MIRCFIQIIWFHSIPFQLDRFVLYAYAAFDRSEFIQCTYHLPWRQGWWRHSKSTSNKSCIHYITLPCTQFNNVLCTVFVLFAFLPFLLALTCIFCLNWMSWFPMILLLFSILHSSTTSKNELHKLFFHTLMVFVGKLSLLLILSLCLRLPLPLL